MRLGHVFAFSLTLAVVGATACSGGIESSCGSFFDTTIARANKCGGVSFLDPATKTNFEKFCDALNTAPGTNNLSGQIDSCNSKTQAADCNTNVDCKIAGTLADGAACGVSTQCSGARCVNTTTVVPNSEVTCGQCASYVAVGGACSSNGATCDPATGSCHNGTCTALAQQGADCTNASCANNLVCVSGTCQPYPTKGQPCTFECQSPYVCSNQVCADAVPQGGACTNSLQCASGLTCDATKKCSPPVPAQLGQPCGIVQTAFVTCVSGLKCQNTTSTCVVPKTAGETCTVGQGECETYLACVNGTCQVPDYSVCK